MQILVTGGTGVVGASAVTALVQRGHVVSLFSRHAKRDARRWPHSVHPFAGSVTNPASLTAAATGCDAVLHLTGIVHESGTETFESVNIEGTRNVLRAAEAAGIGRFIHVSSLGADTGMSPYHESKRGAETLVRAFPREWVILRPGNVYGPGDEQISALLRMVRTMPAIPVIGGGDQSFQPIWHEDLAHALAASVDQPGLHGATLELAGEEKTSQNDLLQRLARLTGREISRVPVPELLANIGLRVASIAGVNIGFSESQLQMLVEGNEIPPGRDNALVATFKVTPTPLDEGLRKLADAQQELLPSEGVGPLQRKRYWADITGSSLTPEALMTRVHERFAELLADFIDGHAEPGVDCVVEEGATLTLSLPLRGNIQVRVAESEPRVLTLVTVEGHPLAGAVRFLSETRGDDLRFEIQVYDRAASVVDLVVMRALGERVQDASWREMIEKVVRVSGGHAARIDREAESLDEAQADLIDEWLSDLVMERKREAAGT
jgi:NADH dehydrogenase